MKVKYFPDTDTALIEFTDKEVHETKEISENIYMDLDKDGNLVNMTIEHAKTNAKLWKFSFQEMGVSSSLNFAEPYASTRTPIAGPVFDFATTGLNQPFATAPLPLGACDARRAACI